jgi:hypothetical protein
LVDDGPFPERAVICARFMNANWVCETYILS